MKQVNHNLWCPSKRRQNAILQKIINLILSAVGTSKLRIYSLFKIERLRANIELTLHKVLIRSVTTYACPAWEFAADTSLLKLQRLKTRFSSPLKFSKVHTGRRRAHSFQPSVRIRLYNKIAGTKQKSHKIVRLNMFAV
jgi:hypothetical protein